MAKQVRWRVGREEWAKRVERWRESGLTAGRFAAEQGINARTLTYWKWMLGKESRGERRKWPSRKPKGDRVLDGGLVEITSTGALVELRTAAGEERFELELGAGRRLRVPASFDPMQLKRLLEVLEGR